MERINMSAIARKNGLEMPEVDTFGQIAKDEILSKTAQGYDLFELVYPDSNTHAGFEWVKAN